MATPNTGALKRRAGADDVPAHSSLDEIPPAGAGEGGDAGELARWEEDEKIRDIIANEENAGAKLEIYRKNLQGTWAYLTMLGVEEWTPEARHNIAREFGGGDYKARVRKASGLFGASFQFLVDRSVKAAGAGASDRPSDLLEIVRLNKGDSAGMMPMFMSMMQAQQQQAMAAQAQMTQVLVAALSRGPAPGPSDKLMEVLLTKSMAPAPSLDFGKLIGALRDLQELSGANGGRRGGRSDGPAAPQGGGDGFWPSVMAQLPNLLAMVAQAGLLPGVAAAAAPAIAPLAPPPGPLPVAAPLEPVQVHASAPPVTVPPEGAAPPAPTAADENRRALAALAEAMVAQAVAGADPLASAVQLSESLDDANFAALAVVLQRSDWFALLADAHDPVMMQSPWFGKWRERLLAEVEEAAP